MKSISAQEIYGKAKTLHEDSKILKKKAADIESESTPST